MNRVEILETAHHYITKDRAATHGKAEDSFALIAAYWSADLGVSLKPHDVARLMALMKLARMRGNPKHIDSYIDAAAYSALSGEIATKEAK